MSRSSCPSAFPVLALAAIIVFSAGSLLAVQVPERSGVGEKIFRHPDLDISAVFRLPSELLAGEGASLAAADLAALGVPANRGRLDARGGRWGAITPSQPLVPGAGVGNELSWEDLGRSAPADDAALRDAVAEAFRNYLQSNAAALRVDVGELAGNGRATVHDGATVAQMYVPRVVDGVPVRDSYLTAVINHGNLVLLGTNNWGDVTVSTVPTISAAAASSSVQAFVEPFTITGSWGKTELILVPTARGSELQQVQVGQGYGHRLAWIVRPSFADDLSHWEALVDAHTNELISFEDTNRYSEVKGGVYPISNDGLAPDGVEQAGWPMPFDDISTTAGTVTSDSGGNFTAAAGNRTSNLSGPFVNINDNCGAISLTTTGDIDFGTSGGGDCVTPGFGGAGNTHSARTGFYELNRIIEQAKGQLPANTWLGNQLTANMNINLTCNAFWNGSTVNFYRSGGGCGNTGELAGVFDHEWGHGMDDNDANPSISSPGEGIADLYAYLRLNASCIGRGFFDTGQCGGYGDPCVNCDGIRDIDWAMRASGAPHDVDWAIANCGGGVHCRGYIYSESVYDLINRDLPTLFGMDHNTAFEVGTRLTYVGGGNVGTWFVDTPPFGGCGATGGYLNYLAADDDNGNINDGTPHMTAIFAAFDRHQIACDTPVVQDSGCAGTPSSPPVVATTPFDQSATLSWGAVAGATTYEVFRTDGVFACDFGKTKVGETTGTSFNDSGLQNGRDYSYVVIPIGAADSCFGPASACATVTPAPDPNCNNDGICDSGEDCFTCANDCISGTTVPPQCGNGLCEAGDGEDCVSCPADCNGRQSGKPANRFCCGFGGQNPVGCADSACTTGGFSCTEVPQPSVNYCCGDATCDGAEDSFSCELDCGPPPPQCLPRNDACTVDSECCSGICKNNGRCR